jgi:hypothetical protein
MDRKDPTTTERESPERTAAPPIEREHETLEGILEEDERRERERRSAGKIDPSPE